jgi:hypothetical protein
VNEGVRVITVLAVLVGCGPAMPDESSARLALAQRDAFLTQLDRLISGELAGRPRPVSEILSTCGAAPRGECGCQVTAMDFALHARSSVAGILAAQAGKGLLGAEVEVTCGLATQVVARLQPFPPGQRRGSRDLADALLVDGRRLGWGLYQTAWNGRGDGAYHPGIAVAVDRLLPQGVPLTIQAFFLTDEWTRPAEWPPD